MTPIVLYYITFSSFIYLSINGHFSSIFKGNTLKISPFQIINYIHNISFVYLLINSRIYVFTTLFCIGNTYDNVTNLYYI